MAHTPDTTSKLCHATVGRKNQQTDNDLLKYRLNPHPQHPLLHGIVDLPFLLALSSAPNGPSSSPLLCVTFHIGRYCHQKSICFPYLTISLTLCWSPTSMEAISPIVSMQTLIISREQTKEKINLKCWLVYIITVPPFFKKYSFDKRNSVPLADPGVCLAGLPAFFWGVAGGVMVDSRFLYRGCARVAVFPAW